ncbi:type IV pilus modification PilV family protein [Parvibium lacunae]|uniref:Uncharacterized protein n=1 Tax=Parvibium lacunae TaxID=1888893 RepID=A0A368L1F2_9BURK|nr:hypothetical protein [Parvibium lacunae]RCS57385.1 hypothetical protein DU000_07930 [Parvibium lacunae]
MMTSLSLPPSRSTLQRQSGVILLEVMVAAVICILGILGVMGLHSNMLAVMPENSLKADAALMANEYINEMWALPANTRKAAFESGARFTAFQTTVQNRFPNGSVQVVVSAPYVTATAKGSAILANDVTVTVQYLSRALNTQRVTTITATVGG